MPRKLILPTIVAVYDESGLAFYCDGEPIEDMEFTWDDLADPELLVEVAEELVEYIDGDEIEDIDNPVGTVTRALRQLRKSKVARKAAPDDDGGDDDPDEDYEDDDD